MSITQKLRAFFTTVQSFLFQLPPISDPPTPSSTPVPVSPHSIHDPESQAGSASNTNTNTNTNMSIGEKLQAFLTSLPWFSSKIPPRSDPPAPSSPTLPPSSPSIHDSESQAGSASNTNANMSIAEKLKAFLTSVQTFLSQLPPRSDPPPSSSPTLLPSSPSINDSESQAVSAPNTQQVQNPNQFLLQWQNVVMTFCLTSAIEIALLYAQTKSQLPVSFHLLSFVILLIFLSLFVAKFVGEKLVFTFQVLEKVAILLAATSFILTITIPLPLRLKCAAWILYALCLFIVVICNKV